MSLSRRTVLSFALACLPGLAAAQSVFTADGAAIRGYDPVAYFTEGRPVQGDPGMALQWGGARWQFATEANRALFEGNPAAYAPQFGGYCAWAVSRGYTAPIDPEAWKVVDGKLYLNYSKGVQRQWEADVPGNIAKAEANWPRLGG
ncbi:YHS domain protein [Fertoebacter nigrum]|uniref:YHS domain protein n=2 Tax=Fertoeibacter niger TaxID=2656921 RepID=A0A8X8H323_9RHOB|nr:YHS domain-containing (seleno)protein [Fertoeibacter niger]NUB45404.1 YHS domain protein [Fertoeibacter niger]